jgi:hypothetical protein
VGKISNEAKKRYFDKLKEYKIAIDQIIQREKTLNTVLESDENGIPFKKLLLADETLNLVSYYILMNEMSVSLLGMKNEGFLNDARKGCYKSIIYLEEVVSPYVDVPFSEYEEKLKLIDGFEDEKRYALLKKLGFTIAAVSEGFGDNTKWKWSFAEIEGRYAVVAKNLLNMKTFIAGLDPRVKGYEARFKHMILVKKLLQQSADKYRQKYELSTLRIDDFKTAIGYLSALRRIHILLGESAAAEELKKKVDVWKGKMENDLRKAEDEAKSSKSPKP